MLMYSVIQVVKCPKLGEHLTLYILVYAYIKMAADLLHFDRENDNFVTVHSNF